MNRWTRRVATAAGIAGLVLAELVLLGPGFGFLSDSGGAAQAGPSPLAVQGRGLFVAGCSSCHGFQARGIRGVAPSLRGVGALAADFYLSTGRMPLNSPDQQPTRSKPKYSKQQIAALNAYIGSFGGPGIPRVSMRGTTLSQGQALFASNCSGCHQAAARGGIVTGAFVPSLLQATPRQIVEAARIGPYVMPRFGPGILSNRDLAAIARYVHWVKSPPDRGGWGIGHIGPIPEGMIAWLVAMPLLLLVTRAIGERTER